MSGEEGLTSDRRAEEEGLKLFYDSMKHLTTLSTGSILVLIAFLEKVFASPRWKVLIILSLICLIVSTLGAVGSMLYISESIGEVVIVKERKDYAVNSYLIALASFILGIIILVVFTARNLYQ